MKKNFIQPEVSVHTIASESVMLDISSLFANLFNFSTDASADVVEREEGKPGFPDER